MIEVKSYVELPEVIPPFALVAWRKSLEKIPESNIPPEVISFINAISAKMAAFARIRTEKVKMIGFDLRLTGMKEINGAPIDPWEVYDFDVPYLVAVDHRTWMFRIFRRRGKHGLIDYCKAQVKKTELERVLSILEVNVFHNERPEFRKVMAEIQAAKKLE
jgi:hypothetical protein